jgi:hypothetical protein
MGVKKPPGGGVLDVVLTIWLTAIGIGAVLVFVVDFWERRTTAPPGPPPYQPPLRYSAAAWAVLLLLAVVYLG